MRLQKFQEICDAKSPSTTRWSKRSISTVDILPGDKLKEILTKIRSEYAVPSIDELVSLPFIVV